MEPVIPQIVVHYRGSGGYSLGVDETCAGAALESARQLLCAGCGLGEGRYAPVQTKRSLAPLSTEKHNRYGTFPLQTSLCPLSPQMPPRWLPDASRWLPDGSPQPLDGPQMAPRRLLDGSQMPPRCLPDGSQMTLR